MMSNSSNRSRFLDVSPRLVADFIIVHLAMLLAFVVSIVYQTYIDRFTSASDLVIPFRHYYIHNFIWLSLIFPVTFYLNGLYTYVRFLESKPKFQRFVLTVFLATTIFVAANFLLVPRQNPLGRSAAIAFPVIVILGLAAIRVAKEWLLGKDGIASADRTQQAEEKFVLVIGGAGYIGCWLVKRLLEEGRRVRILDNGVYGLESIRDLLAHPRVEYLDGDCRNIQDVVKAMRNVSSVVHLAAIVGDPACELDHKATIEINYAATRMIVEIAKGHGVERFLFASSCSVYGASSEFMDEHSRVEPISLYGQTKVASERALLDSASASFHPVVMRFATVFGLSNRPRFDLVVNLLAAKAIQDHVITIYNGQQWRPFIHVKDLAEAMLLLLKAPLSSVSREIFNVGDNRLNYTLSGVADVIQRMFPGTRVEHVENSDMRNYRVNFQKIEKRIGFRAKYTLEAGIGQVKAAYESSEIDNYKNVRFSNLVYLRESGTPQNKTDVDAEVMAAFGGEEIRKLAPVIVEAPAVRAKAASAS